MGPAMAVYAALGIISLVLLTLLLPFIVLPASCTSVPPRDFGVFHASIVLASLVKSALVPLEMHIRQHGKGKYKLGKQCNADAALTMFLTMVVAWHFPLIALNIHFKVTTRDHPLPKLFKTAWACVGVFIAYLIPAAFLVSLLVSWGAHPGGYPFGAFMGQHCNPVEPWWRYGRIVTLFIPLAVAVAICIPCALSVTLRHHLFAQRDIRALRIEVAALCGTAGFGMAFMIFVWARTAAAWPRPLEGALGILVFIMVISERVLKQYLTWLSVLLPSRWRCLERDSEAQAQAAFGSSDTTIAHDPMAPVEYLAPPRRPRSPAGSVGSAGSRTSRKKAKGNRILATADMSDFITRIRPLSAQSAPPRWEEDARGCEKEMNEKDADVVPQPAPVSLPDTHTHGMRGNVDATEQAPKAGNATPPAYTAKVIPPRQPSAPTVPSAAHLPANPAVPSAPIAARFMHDARAAPRFPRPIHTIAEVTERDLV